MADNDPKDPKRKNRSPLLSQLLQDNAERKEVPGVRMEADEQDDDDEDGLEVQLQFWKQVLAFEHEEWVAPFDVLVRGGIVLPPPEALDDTQLTAKLWEVINSLALLGAYLVSTDHLSDRMLYEELWRDVLRDGAVLRPDNLDFAYYIDCIGSGSEEDTAIYLKYYADEEDREQWAEQWPDEALPVPEPLPFERDQHLPTPEKLRAVGSGKA